MAKDWDKMDRHHQERYLKAQGGYYGMNLDDYQPEDTGSQEPFEMDRFQDELFRRARTDPYKDGSVEAARLSGNSDLPISITNAEDLYAVNSFMEKTFDENDLGNTYNSANDAAAVRNYLVDQDRANLLDSVTPPKDDQQTDVALEPPTPVELSDREIAAKERVNNHSYTDVGMGLSPDGSLTFPSVTDNSSKDANDFRKDYSFKVKEGLRLAGVPTRGPDSVGAAGGLAS